MGRDVHLPLLRSDVPPKYRVPCAHDPGGGMSPGTASGKGMRRASNKPTRVRLEEGTDFLIPSSNLTQKLGEVLPE